MIGLGDSGSAPRRSRAGADAGSVDGVQKRLARATGAELGVRVVLVELLALVAIGELVVLLDFRS